MNERFFVNGKVLPSDVLTAVRKIDPAQNDLYRKTDDISTSQLFSDIFSSVARYNTTAKEWYCYNGIVWKRDEGGMIVENFAKMLSRALVIYSGDVSDTRYREYVAKLGERKRRVTMLQDARDFNFLEAKDFDRNTNLFNCANCVIDLDTFAVLDHDPSLLLSKVSNVYYDPEVQSSDFKSFLDAIMQGDRQKMTYLQKIFGYALTGENTQEECYMIYGSTTRNGKSTLLDTLEYLFGDYASNIQPETLAQQKDRNSRTASGDIARLDGCRFLHMSEPPKRMKFDVALLKTLLGRDVVTARHLYEREFQFTPIFKLFINTNFLPIVTDDTLFSSGRVKVISFDRHFESEEQDPRLKSRLKKRENISGIFNWCLEGLRIYRDDEETIVAPPSVQSATNDYRVKSDKIQNFVNECLVRSEKENTTAKEAYSAFDTWCRDNGYGVENKKNFLEELRSKGLLFETGTVNGKTYHNVILGYALDYPESNTGPYFRP